MTNSPYAPPTTLLLETEEKLCSSCHAVIHKNAKICPQCGVRQKMRGANKKVLLLLTFFLGGLGIHRFYLGDYLLGIFYFLFFWTMIPFIIALVEFIDFIFTSSEKIEDNYTAHGSVVALALVPISLIFISIIKPIMSDFYDYIQKTKVAEAIILFNKLKIEAEAHLANTGHFPSTAELKSPVSGAYVDITSNPEKLYFLAVMNDNAGAIAGKMISFSYNSSSKSWKCSADFTNGVADKYLTKNCRTNKQR
jgi:TM2 domain-containing membrane protein YozV/Tfp pilus assembly major pilin PilA